jgi:Tfp pilus assembly protein PilF
MPERSVVNKNNIYISFGKKAVLIILGLLAFVILAEIGLHLGGIVFSSLQEYKNSASIRQKGAYRILCLGESTTLGSVFDSYPLQLEKILNDHHTGIKFSVINKGTTGINTSYILNQLQENLDKYHPNMVIAMMGINDERVKYYEDILDENTNDVNSLLFKYSRLYRLIRFIGKHLANNKHNTPKEKSAEPSAAQAGYPKASLGDNSLPDKSKDIDQKFTNGLSKNEGVHKTQEEPYKNQEVRQIEHGVVKTGYPNAFSRNNLLPDKPRDINQKFTHGLSKNEGLYKIRGGPYKNREERQKAEESILKAIELNPKDDHKYIELAWFYEGQTNLVKAEESFKKAIDLNPKNDLASLELAWFYDRQGNRTLSEKYAREATEINPNNPTAYTVLALFYRSHGKNLEAEQTVKKAVELGLGNGSLLMELARNYCNQNKFSQAEEAFKKAIRENNSLFARMELGIFYKNLRRYPEAEEQFKKLTELDPQDDKALGALIVLYEETGKHELAEDYKRKADVLRSEFSGVTRKNYQILKQILDKRGIKLVCAQYPLRNIDLLKKALPEADNVIFVDNEKVFKDAIRQKGSNYYFTDMFAGDFGHCTPQGNALLAENITNVILKEGFGKEL